jgi:hypothetical protein
LKEKQKPTVFPEKKNELYTFFFFSTILRFCGGRSPVCLREEREKGWVVAVWDEAFQMRPGSCHVVSARHASSTHCGRQLAAAQVGIRPDQSVIFFFLSFFFFFSSSSLFSWFC